MAWIYLAELEGLELRSPRGSEPSLIASANDTHKAYFCRECNLVTLTSPLYGMMCKRCEENTYPKLKLFLEASLAKIFPPQGGVSELRAEQDRGFSSKSQGSLKKSSLPLFFSKTHPPLEPEGSTLFYENLPRQGMIVDGQCYRLQASALLTKEIGGFLWPTPRTTGLDGGANSRRAAKARGAWVDESVPESGRLNPEWVEWLMGYPTEWTELSASVIPWFRSKRKKLLNNC